MRTLAATLAFAAIAALTIACAKDSPAPSTSSDSALTAAKVADTTPTAANEGADDGADVSCGTPGMECGQKSEEGGGCNKWDDAAAAVASRDVPNTAVWKTLKVSGMTCGGCERRVVAHVGKIANVVSVEADSELGQVRVAMKSDDTETARAAEAEIRRLGYRVE